LRSLTLSILRLAFFTFFDHRKKRRCAPWWSVTAGLWQSSSDLLGSCLFPIVWLAESVARIPNTGFVAPTEKGMHMRQNGTVKFFNTTKGFGFITPEGGSKDVFVHITALERAGIRSLNEGQKVTFETENDKRGRGPQAVNVQLA
jgi:CspA family cold shock protein